MFPQISFCLFFCCVSQRPIERTSLVLFVFDFVQFDNSCFEVFLQHFSQAKKLPATTRPERFFSISIFSPQMSHAPFDKSGKFKAFTSFLNLFMRSERVIRLCSWTILD